MFATEGLDSVRESVPLLKGMTVRAQSPCHG
jgi:hypothetical protein